MTTFSADSSITDSAASATAMATGTKVNNGVISQAYPGNGEDLTTILEIADIFGMGTGVVTTTVLSHATPAAFAGHASNRGNYEEIVDLSGGNHAIPSAGLFGSGHLPYELDGLGDLPHLSDLVDYALNTLENHYNGFFLLVEGGRIDHACHDNDLPRALGEVLEFSDTVNLIRDWARERDDFLIIVTADHETGGLSILNDNGIGSYPDVSWSTDYHTGVPVSYFVWGDESGKFT